MGAIAYQITSLTIVYSIVYSDADQWNHQSSASLAFVLGIHRWPVNSPHKWPVTRKNVSIWWRHHGLKAGVFCNIGYLSQTHLGIGVTNSNKQRVLMHGHQGWNVRHGLCHIYMIYVYIWVVYSFCLFYCLFIIVTTQFVALYKPCKPKPKPSTYDPPGQPPRGRDPKTDT